MTESGVSSVVGVILALSITITVAGVLIAFAAGMVSPSEKPPSADFGVSSLVSGENITLLFEHKGGDKISPSDIKVTALVKKSGAEDITGSRMLSEITNETLWSAGETRYIDTENTSKLLSMTKKELKEAAEIHTAVKVSMYYVPGSVIIYSSDIILEES